MRSQRASCRAPTHERIALAVAETNGCDYCLSAHAYLGRHVAKLDDAEMIANRGGNSNDSKADAGGALRAQGHGKTRPRQ